jgi:serine protease Do
MVAGTVVSRDGLIVTFGLPPGEGHLRVRFETGEHHRAEVVARDLRTGLHLLRIPHPRSYRPLAVAEQPAEIGDTVVAGYCLGERDRAIARGIVVSAERMPSGFSVGLLQTDATVGRMSAGGPLVNESGALVGILAAVQMHDGQPQGVTLAIPAEHVRALRKAWGEGEDGEVVVIQRPLLGIQPVERPDQGGVGISQVFENSPAEAAGLRTGDEIVALNRERVHSPQDVVRIVGGRTPGDQIEVTIRRDGQEQVLTVTLAQVPAEPRPSPPETVPRVRVSASTPTRILVYGPDGTVQSLELPATPAGAPPLVSPAIRVERSDVEQKLDELSRDVRELKTQIEELSRQLQRQAEGGSAN